MRELPTLRPCTEAARVGAFPRPVTTPRVIAPRTADAPHVVPGGYDRVASTLALKPLLREFGVELEEVLAQSGLPAGLFDQPDNLIPFRQGSRLLGLCVDLTRCAHLGLLIGRHTPLEALGLVADLVKAAPDVRGALNLLSRYLTLSDGGGLATLSEDAHVASYGYALYEPGVERAEVVYDLVLASIWNIIRALCGSRWLPREIRFMRRRPPDTHPYRSFLRATAALRLRTFRRGVRQGLARPAAAQCRSAAAAVAGGTRPHDRSPGHRRVAGASAARAAAAAAERRHLDAAGGARTGYAPPHAGPQAAVAWHGFSGPGRRGPV